MESTPQEEAEGQAIVRVLAVVLERLVSANSHLAANQQEETKFHALRAPAIGILQYLERIHKYASCSKECFILALIYIDRLIQRNNFLLTDLNVHRVVITAVLLAAKFFDDAYYNNAYYAKVGGVLVSEMNTLEVEFLFKIDFSLRVVPDVFEKYYAELIGHSSSGGMERIEMCTDEELFRGVHPPQHQQVLVGTQQAVPEHQLSMVQQAQAPLLQTQLHAYSQAELQQPEPAVYHNTTQAASQLEACSSNHYPLQALQHSVTVPNAAQLQAQAVLEQQQTASAALEQLFPFPALAHQVSVPQQAQAPVLNPSELNLVYHHNNPAAAVTATHTPASAAPQDVPLSHFNSSQALHHSVTAGLQAQVYPQQTPQAPVYSQQTEIDQAYYSALAATQSTTSSHFSNLVATAAAAQAPYSQPQSQQHANYNYNTQAAQAPSMAPLTQLMMQQQQSLHHPEITPSPPPQPTIKMRGPPIAYPAGEVGIGASCAHLGNLASSAAYLKSANAANEALLMHGLQQVHQQQQHNIYPPSDVAAHAMIDSHHHHHQATTHAHQLGGPIVGNTHHHHGISQTLAQDNISGSWSRMMYVERGGDPP